MKRSTKQPSKSTTKSKSLVIGLVIDDSLDRPDGVQQYVLTLGAWLTAQGHEVHYIASETTRIDLPNLHVLGRSLHVRFNGNRLRSPLPASNVQIRNLLTSVPFDVLHVQMPYSPFLAGKVLRSAQKLLPNCAQVATFHIFPESSLVRIGGRLLSLLQQRQYKQLDQILSVSSAAANFASKTFGVDSTIVPNGVELEPFIEEASHAKHKTPYTIVFLGRLVERKGCRQLIEAIAAARERLPKPLRVRIGGRGPLLEQLKALTERLKLSDVISFEGFIAEEDKASFLASGDMVVLPSLGGESFGISVVEALAASNGPVLAGDNAGYRSVMQGLERQLVPGNDPTGAFADKLVKFAALSSSERQAYKKRQQLHAEQFAVQSVGARVVAQYQSALRLRSK